MPELGPFAFPSQYPNERTGDYMVKNEILLHMYMRSYKGMPMGKCTGIWMVVELDTRLRMKSSDEVS
jgi:hypothetical protein